MQSSCTESIGHGYFCSPAVLKLLRLKKGEELVLNSSGSADCTRPGCVNADGSLCRRRFTTVTCGENPSSAEINETLGGHLYSMDKNAVIVYRSLPRIRKKNDVEAGTSASSTVKKAKVAKPIKAKPSAPVLPKPTGESSDDDDGDSDSDEEHDPPGGVGGTTSDAVRDDPISTSIVPTDDAAKLARKESACGKKPPEPATDAEHKAELAKHVKGSE